MRRCWTLDEAIPARITLIFYFLVPVNPIIKSSEMSVIMTNE